MASVTELRQNATNLIKEVGKTHEPIFIFQKSKKKAVLIDEETFSELVQAYQDQCDLQLAEEAFVQKKEKRYTLKDIENMREK